MRGEAAAPGLRGPGPAPRHAEPEDRRVALGVAQGHVPAVLIDAACAGVSMRSAAVTAPGELGVGKAILVLHPGPVLARRRKLLSSEFALVREKLPGAPKLARIGLSPAGIA